MNSGEGAEDSLANRAYRSKILISNLGTCLYRKFVANMVARLTDEEWEELKWRMGQQVIPATHSANLAAIGGNLALGYCQ